MKGFDEEFADIVDYIVKITNKIWEEKGVGRIYDYYQPNCSVHTAYGLSYGREEVVAGTLQMLAAFPDRRLHATNIIWSGNEQDGFHTSHLITSEGHNTGYSAYGPPTERKVTWRAIANCFVKENRIVEEWLVRDELHLVQQLGFDEWEVAMKLAQQQPVKGIQPQAHGEIERILGQTTPEALELKPGEVFDIEDFVMQSYHEIWNWRRLDKIRSYYEEDYICHTASGRELSGLDEYTAYVLMMFGMFPDAKMTIDHLYWNGSDADGYQVAARWSLVGTHTGPGVYGEPTGKRVYIMGISHLHVKGGKFIAEWTVFDEIAVLKQLSAPNTNSSIQETNEENLHDVSEQDQDKT